MACILECAIPIEGVPMTIKRLHISPRFCEAAIHNQTAYLAGQVPEHTLEQGAYEQTTEVLALIDHLLAEIGSHKSKILSAQVFLSDMADYAEFNRAWDNWVDNQNPPTRATVQAKLADPRWKVEIVIISAL